MTDFPYRDVAARMRMETPPPTADQYVNDYYASRAIYALIYAMEELADD